MSTQTEIYEKRQLMGATLQLAANALQNPIEDLTWAQVEAMKKDIETSRKVVAQYFNDINQCIQDNCPDWRNQWDLAFTIVDGMPDDYNPDDYDFDTVVSENKEKGLNDELAEIVARSIIFPEAE